MLALYFFQERLIFHRYCVDEAIYVRVASDELVDAFQINNSEVLLHGWHVNQGMHTLIIYYGGNADEATDNVDDMKRHLSDYSVLLVNYRGYGKSNGEPSEQALYEDALFVYDYVKEHMNYERIIVMGRSLGSAVAVYVGSQRKVDGLIIVTPFDSIANVGQGHYPLFPVKWVISHPFHAKIHCKGITAPALCVLADHDLVVPRRRSQALLDAWQGSINTKIVDESMHNDIIGFSDYWKYIKSFLN